MDEGLFSFDQLKSNTKSSPTTVAKLQYADDVVACANWERELQRAVNMFIEAYKTERSAISAGKSKVVRWCNLNSHCVLPSINIHEEVLINIDHLLYNTD